MNTALPGKKIIEWKSAFYSMEDSQNKDARILASLITGLSAEIRARQHLGVA
ncbi:hypothetical protein NsoK4_06670 [Nitrosopumilus sp. K4]|uniref:hypothetical protein n=1 Tax=Nitrosopumilus sp. K4 TaxID=2795383 RepID=UPI001BA5B4E4|nr:hypothetical protein [Nitrosopumilus sp. K4]QUC64127.1 hypothetical protein NsoK4_06670 [Nitrosopumilus sp. K4]